MEGRQGDIRRPGRHSWGPRPRARLGGPATGPQLDPVVSGPQVASVTMARQSGAWRPGCREREPAGSPRFPRSPSPETMSAKTLPEILGGLPNLCGSEDLIAEAVSGSGHVYLPDSGIDFDRAKSFFANALHMQQPLIPAGGDDLRTADVISNLKYMMDHPEIGDNHNAPVFHWCYKRMGEFIPELIRSGKRPRIMLEYSGCLLHGLRQMGLHDVFDSLMTLTCDPTYRRHVEWLGAPWGHAVAPSTPVQDYRLHVRAWQHHFAAIFGLEALGGGRTPCLTAAGHDHLGSLVGQVAGCLVADAAVGAGDHSDPIRLIGHVLGGPGTAFCHSRPLHGLVLCPSLGGRPVHFARSRPHFRTLVKCRFPAAQG